MRTPTPTQQLRAEIAALQQENSKLLADTGKLNEAARVDGATIRNLENRERIALNQRESALRERDSWQQRVAGNTEDMRTLRYLIFAIVTVISVIAIAIYLGSVDDTPVRMLCEHADNLGQGVVVCKPGE